MSDQTIFGLVAGVLSLCGLTFAALAASVERLPTWSEFVLWLMAVLGIVVVVGLGVFAIITLVGGSFQ